MLKELSFTVLTKAINKIIASDPFAEGYLKVLNQKSLRLGIQKVALDIVITFNEKGIEIINGEDNQGATVTITGTPSNLLKFAKSHEHTRLLMEKNVKIEGDLETLLDIKKMQEQLDIDWEGFLANYMSDFAANRIMNISRYIGAQLSYQFKRARHNVADYIKHETDVLVQQREMDTYSQAILDLRRNIDRLEARIKLLGQKH